MWEKCCSGFIILNALSILDKDEGVAIRGGRVDSTLLEGQSIVEADLQLGHTADSIVSYKWTAYHSARIYANAHLIILRQTGPAGLKDGCTKFSSFHKSVKRESLQFFPPAIWSVLFTQIPHSWVHHSSQFWSMILFSMWVIWFDFLPCSVFQFTTGNQLSKNKYFWKV